MSGIVDGMGYGFGAVYSCGCGQIIGIPGSLISLIVALFQKIASSFWSCKSGQEAKGKAATLNEDAKYSLVWAGTFALGMIPIVGGALAYHIFWK